MHPARSKVGFWAGSHGREEPLLGGHGWNMFDSQRLRSTPAGIRMVSEVAAELARRSGGRTSVLAVATYFPVDVDSVARVFEALEEIEGIERIEEGALTLYEIEEVDRFERPGPDVSQQSFIDESAGFVRALGTLKRDEDWVERVQAQHELLRIVADAEKWELELTYLTSRSGKSRARIQSLLNDFDAQGYIHVEIDEEIDQLLYHFPELDYPDDRFERNMRLLEEAEPPARSRVAPWIVLAVVAAMILLVVVLLRL